MRLINVDTRRLEEFFDSSIPNYAILSHTWGVGEVTLQEFEKYPSKSCTDLDGYHKIDKACSLAEAEGLQYVWVDSCCIDKKSSAELSEAINSMFRWYRDAEVCFVHMADIQLTEFNMGDLFSNYDSSFRRSRWFTRGWTLQELLAPRKLHFFTKHWHTSFIICRNEATWEYSYFSRDGKQQYDGLLQSTLEEITGINLSTWSQAGPAEILSWAAERQTTRKEDMAYCLLGLLNINMPLLYGEGEAAFPRLMSEVTRVTNDHSIFAAGYNLPWSLSIGSRAASQSTFASHAKEYQGCSYGFVSAGHTFPFRLVDYNNPELLAWSNRHSVDTDLRHSSGTGAGLQIRLPMVEIDPVTGTYLGLLNCYRRESHDQLSMVLQGADLTNDNHFQHIELSKNTRWSDLKKEHDIFRVAPGTCPILVPPLFRKLATLRTIYIQSDWPLEQQILQLSFPDLAAVGFSLGSVYPPSSIHRDSDSEFMIAIKSVIQSLQLFMLFLHPKLKGSLVLGVFQDSTGEHYKLAWSPARSCIELLLAKVGRTLRPDGFNEPEWIGSHASVAEISSTWSPAVYLEELCRKLDWKESLELKQRANHTQSGLIKASCRRADSTNSHILINLL